MNRYHKANTSKLTIQTVKETYNYKSLVVGYLLPNFLNENDVAINCQHTRNKPPGLMI